MRPAILIHGPTASGKTKLAIALARRLDGEVINADAMQVYGDLDILTARPDADEKAAVPHHMFGHVDAATRYSAGAWSKEAGARIAELRGQDKVPIIVGGTGLYLMSLTDGLSEIPPIPEEARREARARVAQDQAAAYADLLAKDPAAKDRVEPWDERRIVLWALGEMEEEQRAILVLRDSRGLEYDQIAQVLNVPVGTVKSRLFRARAALRTLIENAQRDTPEPQD